LNLLNAMRSNPHGAAAGARPAALHDKIYAPLKIAAVVATLADCGVSAQAALAGTGLTEDQLRIPQTRSSIQQLLIVGRNALKWVDRVDLGVQAGLRMHASAYGMYGYALLCAESLRHAYEMAVRYHQLATPVMTLHWVQTDDQAVWVFPPPSELAHLDLSEAEYQFFLDMQFAVHMTMMKDVMGPWCTPSCARFALSDPEPERSEALSRALECPVSFGQPRNELHYPAEWLDRAPQLANPLTAAQLSGTCAKLMEELKWQAGLARRVVDELTRVPGRFPDIDQVAATLCMAPRTLRRRLDADGTSFSDLLDKVRLALAVDYLDDTTLRIDDVASALDFADAASFRHAFKRWTGKTPNEYRG
jgi:AraC-like DNA-binding protein